MAAGALAQALIRASVSGIVTSITMIGPLLFDISRDLGISVAQAGCSRRRPPCRRRSVRRSPGCSP